MSDGTMSSLYLSSPARYAAVRRILGAADMTVLRNAEGRTAPARVFPASEGAQDWIVEAPVSRTPGSDERRTFTGPVALLRALEYAHATYGSAVYLSR